MSSPSGPELDSRGLHTAGRGGHLSDGQGFSAWATSGRAQEKVPQRLKETTIWKSAVSQAPAASTAVSEVPGDGSSGQREEKAEEPRVEPLPPEWWESSSPEQLCFMFRSHRWWLIGCRRLLGGLVSSDAPWHRLSAAPALGDRSSQGVPARADGQRVI
ncbi:uncharacterized protein [Ovis canadensis]|uniref:uncharacterized protein isoform X2 n=1 Tax=Ovis canadensis TaxID=37174 RepID=UPI003752E40C